MPRCARVKSEDSVYHIMVRSVGDTSLFREDEDKDKYLELFKKHQGIHKFKVYSYCLMDTHAHFIIDANGADISTIMHGINQSYAQRFNNKYKRIGHLFADRFKSIVIKDDRYLVTLSGYIHNNPTDIDGYGEHVEQYKYSSLGIYLGLRKDSLALVDIEFIMQQFSQNSSKAMSYYFKFVKKCTKKDEKAEFEFENQKTEYRSERVILARNSNPENIVKFISEVTHADEGVIKAKNSHRATEMRALCVLLMRCFCNYSFKDICRILGNISQSRVSKLCSIGFDLVYKSGKYRGLPEQFIEKAYTA